MEDDDKDVLVLILGPVLSHLLGDCVCHWTGAPGPLLTMISRNDNVAPDKIVGTSATFRSKLKSEGNIIA